MAKEATPEAKAPEAKHAEEGGSDWKPYALPGAIVIAALILAGAMLSTSSALTAQMKSLETTIKGVDCSAQAPIVGPTAVPTQPPSQQTPPPSGPVDIDVSGRPFTGAANGQVIIVAFSDFQCPYCSRAHATMKQLMSDYSGKIKYVHMNFPLPFHEFAQKAAEAFECAAEQDSAKAYALHDRMFENQAALNVTSLKQYAVDAGLNASAFNTCLDSGSTAQLVSRQMDLGSNKGVSGTPTFFINGQEVVGAQPIAVFKQAVDDALAGAG